MYQYPVKSTSLNINNLTGMSLCNPVYVLVHIIASPNITSEKDDNRVCYFRCFRGVTMFIYVRNAIRLKPMERKGRAHSKVKCPYTEKDGVNNSSCCQLSIEQICFQDIALST